MVSEARQCVSVLNPHLLSSRVTPALLPTTDKISAQGGNLQNKNFFLHPKQLVITIIMWLKMVLHEIAVFMVDDFWPCLM